MMNNFNSRVQSLFTLAITAGAMTLLACGSDGEAAPKLDASVDAADAAPDIGDSLSDAGDASSTNDASSDAEVVTPLPIGPLDYSGRAYFEAASIEDAERATYNASAMYPGDPSFVAVASARLHAIDMSDGTEDWPMIADPIDPDAGTSDAGAANSTHPLAAWTMYDALIVDPTKPFATASYLDVETANGAHTTCGGRWFDDNALNKTATYLASKNRVPVTVVQPRVQQTAQLVFPYLLPPLSEPASVPASSLR